MLFRTFLIRECLKSIRAFGGPIGPENNVSVKMKNIKTFVNCILNKLIICVKYEFIFY